MDDMYEFWVEFLVLRFLCYWYVIGSGIGSWDMIVVFFVRRDFLVEVFVFGGYLCVVLGSKFFGKVILFLNMISLIYLF